MSGTDDQSGRLCAIDHCANPETTRLDAVKGAERTPDFNGCPSESRRGISLCSLSISHFHTNLSLSIAMTIAIDKSYCVTSS